MATSWILAYQALKHLPITIVTPIRSAGPFFTFIGAIVIYKESPNLYQWIGFFFIIFSVILYSRIGKQEGINFKRNKWIFAIIGATFLGASSGLYDKFLIQNLSLNPQTLQFWFCLYTILILLVIVTINWFPYAEKRSQILISVVVGGLLFKEKNKRKKLIPLVGIMIGVFMILYS